MPRLLGFTPTKKMLMADRVQISTSLDKLDSEVAVDIIHNGPIIQKKVIEYETKDIQSIEIPTYTKTAKLPEMPSEIKNYTSIKRNVNLNPLSDE
jgi:hypothetical protein